MSLGGIKLAFNSPLNNCLEIQGTVLLVGLVPGHVLHVPGIDPQDLEVLLQDVEDQFPVDAGAVHGHMRDFLAFAPIP